MKQKNKTFHGIGLFAFLIAGLSCTLAITSSTRAEDWPAWRGPNRDGISKETGWLQKWPAEGPKKLWEAEVGVGYSSFSVSKGRVYTMGNVQDKDGVSCFDAETGKLLWKHEYPCQAKDPNGYNGTRCTPTVDGDRVYTLSRHGNFYCLDAEKGKEIWSKDFAKDLQGGEPKWGFAGSPWIEKDWVLTEVGGPGASVVAFNKMTGDVVWKNGNDPAAYASTIAFDFEGQRVFTQFAKENFILRSMKDGSELWRYPWKTSYGVNAATPIIIGPDQMFLSSGYKFGCALLKFTSKEAQPVWRNQNLITHVNCCILLNGYLYGYSDASPKPELRCVDLKTGEIKWATKDYGKGAVVAADGKLILYGQTGKLGLAEATPEAFREVCSFQAMSGKDVWANPVLANGRIYVRSLDKVAAFDVKGK